MKESLQQSFWLDKTQPISAPTNESNPIETIPQYNVSDESISNDARDYNQQMYWVPERGLYTLLSPQATKDIVQATREGGTIQAEESERLRILANDKTMKKRYPTSEDGYKYMEDVNYERRAEMMGFARELTGNIVAEWSEINPDKPISVVVYGSLSIGLTKRAEHPDPSNIDLTVIGDITDEEGELLKDAIRPYREETQQKILSGCGEIHSDEANPGNAGVSVQSIDKVIANDYGAALGYMRSSAFALHDPSRIWETIEREALQVSAVRFREKENRRKHREEVSQLKRVTKEPKEQPALINKGLIYAAPGASGELAGVM